MEQFRGHHRLLRGVFLIQDGDPSYTAAAMSDGRITERNAAKRQPRELHE